MWYFLLFILFQCFFVVVVVCVCVCVCVQHVCLALRNNDETLCICCILYKLYICVLLIEFVSIDLSALDTGVGSQGCSARPRVADRGSPVDMGCQVIIRIA